MDRSGRINNKTADLINTIDHTDLSDNMRSMLANQQQSTHSSQARSYPPICGWILLLAVMGFNTINVGFLSDESDLTRQSCTYRKCGGH